MVVQKFLLITLLLVAPLAYAQNEAQAPAKASFVRCMGTQSGKAGKYFYASFKAAKVYVYELPNNLSLSLERAVKARREFDPSPPVNYSQGSDQVWAEYREAAQAIDAKLREMGCMPEASKPAPTDLIEDGLYAPPVNHNMSWEDTFRFAN
ncbi:MAG: hypothetical protein AB7K41_05740 [Bdellovibrionales bacterium]